MYIPNLSHHIVSGGSFNYSDPKAKKREELRKVKKKLTKVQKKHSRMNFLPSAIIKQNERFPKQDPIFPCLHLSNDFYVRLSVSFLFL